MSHTISYGRLVFRLDSAALHVARPEQWRFGPGGYPHFLAFELVGASNLTTRHPRTNTEVLSRRWQFTGIGDQTALIQEFIRVSAHCESGGLRLAGQRNSRPEAYIGRWRAAFAVARDFAEFAQHGLTFEGQSFVLRGDGGSFDHVVAVLGDPTSINRWRVNLANPAHQALAIEASGWSNLEVMVSGPRFECEGLRGGS
jgi:hypothetical protein